MPGEFDYGMGRPQIIGGKTYEQYTPEWYAAMDANKVHNAGVAGTAAGTAGANAMSALSHATGTGGGTALPGGAGTGTGVAGGTGAGGGTAPVQQVQAPNTQAASDAAFGRAKDKAGLNARAAITGLNDELAGRGMLGSGVAAGETRKIVEDASGGLNDVVREQAIQDSGNAKDFAMAKYGGDITQRGQDIGANTAARGQDISLQNAQLGRNQSLLQGLMSAIGLY